MLFELLPIITTIVCVAIFVSPWILRFFKDSAEIQTTVTTMGIAGTFTGILISLGDFDIANINDSITHILSGLNVAFWTSVTGIVTALFVSLAPRLYFIKPKTEDERLSDSDLLREISSELKKLNSSIAGDDDSTLITQVQKLRTSVNDKQDELKKSFDDFAQQMAENNVNALIEAVQKVMEDFNAKINDQLGENFKRLSEATENLVTWQDQYREQLATSVEALTKASEHLGTSSESMSTFTERARDFDHVATQLKESLEIMGASMTGLKNLADTLENSGKQIRDEMSDLTKESIKELGENLKGISEKLVEDYSYLQKMMQTVIDKQE